MANMFGEGQPLEDKPINPDEFTEEDRKELNLLYRARTAGEIEIGGEGEEKLKFKWDGEIHQPRVDELEAKKNKWEKRPPSEFYPPGIFN